MRRIFAAIVLAFALAPASAAADWPTYHLDSTRAGNDTTEPTPTPVARDWSSPTLDGRVYAEPLYVNGQLLVATENDTVYALDAKTGAIAWQTSLGNAVSPSWPTFQCGNIDPIGVTSTPVVDAANGVLYAVGLTWDGSTTSSIHYQLSAINLNSGTPAPGAILWQEAIVPAATGFTFNPYDQGQRGALGFNNGVVYIPFGGRAGDCGTYRGWVTAATVTRTAAGAVNSFALPVAAGTIASCQRMAPGAGVPELRLMALS